VESIQVPDLHTRFFRFRTHYGVLNHVLFYSRLAITQKCNNRTHDYVSKSIFAFNLQNTESFFEKGREGTPKKKALKQIQAGSCNQWLCIAVNRGFHQDPLNKKMIQTSSLI
jgi:hypothetical protein